MSRVAGSGVQKGTRFNQRPASHRLAVFLFAHGRWARREQGLHLSSAANRS
jgi:hypothetical protein